MRPKTHANSIRRILNRQYPVVESPLFYNTPFQLLVATILSAQSTDKQVNQVTPELFKRLAAPEDFAAAGLDTIEDLIRSIGLYRIKAKHLQSCARRLIADHGGKVPSSREELISLPGVGRKTANVVLGAAFDLPAVVVDTHVARVSQRLGLTMHQSPLKIEIDLMALIPEKEWGDFCLRLIFLGRETCFARYPNCTACPLNSLCPWPGKSA